MDLQLAYLAAPASAAAANVVQEAPAVAAQAAQAAFINQVQQREETIEESQRAEGTKIRPDPEGGGNAGTYNPRKRKRGVILSPGAEQSETPESKDSFEEPAHFIDTTA
ncbi:MAG: hypothetical protein JOY98_09310 [Candidatus Eremiobacteraeota bacterium]|nr:hypothetical protein [Candidatus Eremiobacteraeota bacterium]